MISRSYPVPRDSIRNIGRVSKIDRTDSIRTAARSRRSNSRARMTRRRNEQMIDGRFLFPSEGRLFSGLFRPLVK